MISRGARRRSRFDMCVRLIMSCHREGACSCEVQLPAMAAGYVRGGVLILEQIKRLKHRVAVPRPEHGLDVPLEAELVAVVRCCHVISFAHSLVPRFLCSMRCRVTPNVVFGAVKM